MVIIISLGVALLFGLMNGVLSLRESVDKFIKENNYSDIKIITNIEDIDKINDLSNENFDNVECRLAINTVVKKDNKILSVKAITYEDEKLKDFYINEEKNNNSGCYDILVEKRFANENNIKPGDILNVKVGEEFHNFCVSKIISVPETIGNVPINGVNFKIVDLSFQSMGRVNYISLADSYKLKSSFETIVLNMDKDKQDELINKESNKENYIYTVFNDEIREYNKEIFDSYTIPAVIIIVFVLCIGNIIVININSYNLLDQKKNLAIFRGLGFQYSEISKSWFIQALIQWITSIIIGIPAGMMLSKYILKYISSVRREFIYASGIMEIIFTMILLFIYIYVGHRKCMRNIRKIDIIEEVKDKD